MDSAAITAPLLPDYQPIAASTVPALSSAPAAQHQVSATPERWPFAEAGHASPGAYARGQDGATHTNTATSSNDATTPLSAQAKKLQQLPAPQRAQLIQENTSLHTRQTALLSSYPTVAKQADARMQRWVDTTYGPGHNVSGLYLVRYGQDAHGHPSHGTANPALEREGSPAEAIPLWKVLQENMPNGSLFGNDYSANRQRFKIVDASDIGKPYGEAQGVLDPEKLYGARGTLDFKSEQIGSVERYYDENQQGIATWAKQRASTQLEVQHVTGGLSDDDYASIKQVLATGKGGKVYTLATGRHVLAGGLRIELDTGRNFTYLPKETEPYRAFENSWDAVKSIRTQGNDPARAGGFVGTYRSLLGDPGLQNPDAIQDLQDGSASKLDRLPTSRMGYDEVYRANHGREYEITHDPFGELVAASRRNDRQDAQAGIKSDADIRSETLKKWGGAGLEILGLLPLDAGLIGELVGGAGKAFGKLLGRGARVGEEAAGATGTATGRHAAEAAARGPGNTLPERFIARGDGNLAVIDELDNTGQLASTPVAPRWPPKANVNPDELELLQDRAVYRDKQSNHFVRDGNDCYQVRRDQQLRAWIAVDPNRPNDFMRSMPVKLDDKGGATPLSRPKLLGGMDDVPTPSDTSEGGRSAGSTSELSAEAVVTEAPARPPRRQDAVGAEPEAAPEAAAPRAVPEDERFVEAHGFAFPNPEFLLDSTAYQLQRSNAYTTLANAIRRGETSDQATETFLGLRDALAKKRDAIHVRQAEKDGLFRLTSGQSAYLLQEDWRFPVGFERRPGTGEPYPDWVVTWKGFKGIPPQEDWQFPFGLERHPVTGERDPGWVATWKGFKGTPPKYSNYVDLIDGERSRLVNQIKNYSKNAPRSYKDIADFQVGRQRKLDNYIKAFVDDKRLRREQYVRRRNAVIGAGGGVAAIISVERVIAMLSSMSNANKSS